MALYTPTGLDILMRVMNKELKATQLMQTDKIGKYVGKYFTFFRFLDLLVQCAIIAFSDPYFSQNMPTSMIMAEMVCLLLERMELSQGFI